MKRTIEFNFGGRTYHLLFNAAALFDCYDHFGAEQSILSHIIGTDRKCFDSTCWLLAKLSQQGELLRRYQGETAEPMLTIQLATLSLSPRDLVSAQRAIQEAIHAGYAREQPDAEAEERDLILEALDAQKKTAPGRAGCSISTAARKILACLSGKPCS